MARIYCMGCGRPLNEGVRFCPACGAPTRLGMEADAPLSPVSPAAEEDERLWNRRESTAPYEMRPEVVVQERARRNPMPMKTMLVGGAAAVLALVLGLAAGIASGVFALGGFSGATQEQGSAALDTAGDAGAEETGSAGIAVREALADYSWQELSIIGKEMTRRGTKNDALTIAHEYHLVDDLGHMSSVTKEVTVAGLGTLHMRLADVYHDALANGEGTAGLTFISTDLTLSHMMKANDDNIGGWEASQMRSWLASEVYGKLDGELAPLVVAVDKHTNNAGATTSVDAVTSTLDTLWIPSVVEVCGQVAWVWDSDPGNSDAYNAVLGAEGTQYACFAEQGVNSTEANAGLVLSGPDGPRAWWLRSSSASKGAHYRMVDETGNPSRWGEGPSELGVCLGFCL